MTYDHQADCNHRNHLRRRALSLRGRDADSILAAARRTALDLRGPSANRRAAANGRGFRACQEEAHWGGGSHL